MYLVHLGLSDNMVVEEEVVNEAAVLMVVKLNKVGDFCKECCKPMTALLLLLDGVQAEGSIS